MFFIVQLIFCNKHGVFMLFMSDLKDFCYLCGGFGLFEIGTRAKNRFSPRISVQLFKPPLFTGVLSDLGLIFGVHIVHGVCYLVFVLKQVGET